MKALKYFIFLVLVVLIGFAVFVGVQPNEYEIVRTRSLNAPAQVVYENVIDFRNWESWSSWVEKDPDIKISYPENTKGVGGQYSWEDKDGIGTMKTLAADPYNAIEQEMQFGDFEPSQVSWNFETDSLGATLVSWKMKGQNVPFMFKAFAAVSGGFDAMIGPDFERGLEKLDSLIQEDMKRYSISLEGIKDYGGGFYLYKTTNADNSNISEKMAGQYGSISSFMAANSIPMAGMPLTVYHEMNMEDQTVIMSNGIPVNEKIEIPEGNDIQCGYIPKLRALKVVLLGNYSNLQEAWSQANEYMKTNSLEPSAEKPFEIYTNDPGQFPNPADWRTELYIPINE